MEELVELITCANAVQHTRFVRVLGKKLTRILQRQTPLVRVKQLWSLLCYCTDGPSFVSPLLIIRRCYINYVCMTTPAA